MFLVNWVYSLLNSLGFGGKDAKILILGASTLLQPGQRAAPPSSGGARVHDARHADAHPSDPCRLMSAVCCFLAGLDNAGKTTLLCACCRQHLVFVHWQSSASATHVCGSAAALTTTYRRHQWYAV